MYLDLFLTIVLFWSLYSGWRQGFIKELISAGGFLLGLIIAATCYRYLGEHLTQAHSQLGGMSNVIAFFLLWIISPIFLGFVANVLTKAVKGMKLGLPNSLLGAAVSALKYIVLLSCVINVMEALSIMDNERTKGSYFYEPAKSAITLLMGGRNIVAPTETDDPSNDGDTVWVNMKQPV